MRIHALIAVFYSLILSSTSQVNFNDYETIQCKGEIPNDFLESFKLDALENINRLENENRAVFKARREFILSSYDILGETLKGGSILFGDPVSLYLSDLLDKILISKPDLRKKLRIYAIKSGYTNAYCTQQGILFVTMGILSKVKSEAELAFILMHEISHYTENHLIERVVETVKKRKSGGYRFSYYSDIIEELLQRSKKNELECDSIAAEYINRSEYSDQVGNDVMDILLRTHLPFEESKFEISIFNDNTFKIPQFFEKKSIDKINLNESKFDAYSTHPNVRTRKKAINRIIAGKENRKTKKFLLSQNKFNEIHEIAKFETVNAHLYHKEYGEAIYCSATLQKKYPHSTFLKNAIAYSLYGLSKYATQNDLHKAAKSVRRIQGESQQVHHLFRQLSKPQINALAIHYINNARKKQPNNKVLTEMIKNLILDMPYIGTKIEDIRNSSEIIQEKDIEEAEKISDKRERIKAKRVLQKKYKLFYLYCLKKDFQNNDLQEFYNEAMEEYNYSQELDNMVSNKRDRFERKKYMQANKDGLHLNGKTVYFLEPTINFEPDRYESTKKYISNIEKKKEFMSLYSYYVKNKLNNLKAEMLTTSKLYKSDVNLFNSVSHLLRWQSEKMYHSTDDIIPISTNRVAKLNENIDYVCGIRFSNFGGYSLYFFYVADMKTGETKYQYNYFGGEMSVKKLWLTASKNLNALSK
jgi:hypothetical protein